MGRRIPEGMLIFGYFGALAGGYSGGLIGIVIGAVIGWYFVRKGWLSQ